MHVRWDDRARVKIYNVFGFLQLRLVSYSPNWKPSLVYTTLHGTTYFAELLSVHAAVRSEGWNHIVERIRQAYSPKLFESLSDPRARRGTAAWGPRLHVKRRSSLQSMLFCLVTFCCSRKNWCSYWTWNEQRRVGNRPGNHDGNHNTDTQSH